MPKTLSQRLDTLVQIQNEANPDDEEIQSDAGEVDQSEANRTTAGICWAEILPDDGSEIVIGGQLTGAQRWVVTVRRRDDLKLSQMLKVLSGFLKGEFLSIEAFARPTRAEEQRVICRQGKLG
jgi:hypothetical protein